VIQESKNSCDKKRKKTKKMAKLINGALADEIGSGHLEVRNYVKKSKKVEKTKSDKDKKLTKDAISKIDADERLARKKKKSVSKSVFNGHNIQSKTFSDVSDAVDHHTSENLTDCVDGDLNKGSFQQSKLHTKDSVEKKNRKRKNENDFQDSLQDESTQCSKKRKTGSGCQSDKTLISSSSVQLGAFENYRISQTMADSLRCV